MELNKYDVVVVGGGHAGVEASHIAAKMGKKTLLITLNLNKIGNMPCNPSIGGSAKGIVVREVDALGGIIGKAADTNYLQMKMLNTGKGPGVQCLRCQQDKLDYPRIILNLLEKTPNLSLLEDEVISIIHEKNEIKGIRLKNNEEIYAPCVILTTGTYMQADILIGHDKVIAGPDGDKPSLGLSPYLRDEMGLELFRLKTGTPQRIKKQSIDFTKLSKETGTEGKLAFSFDTTTYVDFDDQYPCYLLYTNENTHKLIRDNLDKCAMYSGLVEGVGPRYCPSIEDKIVRFSDKPRHQLFLEPESKYSDSYYLQGFSTSMPRELQIEMVHSLKGLEKAIILKYAYAIEYDALVPTQFDKSLMVKKYPGLFCAGQICGTSGYEEAAGLGLIAGINACNFLDKKKPLILRRDEAYIGVMIDDIINKGTNEPYRLLSSRAEFRLLLRHDNADVRLREKAFENGTIEEKVYKKYLAKEERKNKIIDYINSTYLGINQNVTDYLSLLGYDDYRKGSSLADILRRPLVKLSIIKDYFPFIKDFNLTELEVLQIEVSVKYEGYIKKQKQDALKLRKLDDVILPNDIDYLNMEGLALEARSKLNSIKPKSIGDASRISGINPSDITILNLYLNKKRRENR